MIKNDFIDIINEIDNLFLLIKIRVMHLIMKLILFNYENGNSYKKIKKNKEFEICASKKMKENPCFEKLCTNECTEINDDERLKIFHRY